LMCKGCESNVELNRIRLKAARRMAAREPETPRRLTATTRASECIATAMTRGRAGSPLKSFGRDGRSMDRLVLAKTAPGIARESYCGPALFDPNSLSSGAGVRNGRIGTTASALYDSFLSIPIG
jgi:hypothetical protein